MQITRRGLLGTAALAGAATVAIPGARESVETPVRMFTTASSPFNWFCPRVIRTPPTRRAMPVSGT